MKTRIRIRMSFFYLSLDNSITGQKLSVCECVCVLTRVTQIMTLVILHGDL